MKYKALQHQLFYIFTFLLVFRIGVQAEVNHSFEESTSVCLCDPVADSLILVELYNATGGADWHNNTNWLVPGEPISNWHGVTTGSDGCVTCLDFVGVNDCSNNLNVSGNNLEGQIPSALGSLINLQTLLLAKNSLTGNIPAELGNLTNLVELDLALNSLTGSIPSELGNLSNLVRLELSRNSLTGNIPAELGNLSSLVELILWRNSLTGLPAELGNLTNLVELDLYDNFLAGNIPAELGNLSNLEILELSENPLSGSIPPEIGNLTNLVEFSVRNNSLTGSIPAELGNLSNLEILNLTSNALSGSIPAELGNLSNILRINLTDNSLTGSIPSELGNLSNLEVIWLNFNSLTGSIPPELGNLSNLTELILSRNALTGGIPPELGNLSSLDWLSLYDNALTGTIPPELGNLTNLTTLHLYDNSLTGNLPSELGNLSNLDGLNVGNNFLSGCYPSSFSQLNLDFYSFENNPGLPDQGSSEAFENFLINSYTQYGLTCDDGDPNTAGEVILADCSCGIAPFAIEGKIFADSEENCTYDQDEFNLENWIVEAVGNLTYYTHSDSSGDYLLKMDTGTYLLNVYPPNSYWLPCFTDTIVVGEILYDTLELDFPNQIQYECPLMNVQISTPFLRRCFPNIYTVQYCNEGTSPAFDARIEVTLDDHLLFDSASIDPIASGGNTYTFPVDEVTIGECGQFNIYTTLDCESTVLGQTHCTQAYAYPDTICLPTGSFWDGSTIEVEAECNGDLIDFIITNVGDDMTDSLAAIIVEDEFMFRSFQFYLESGQSKVETIIPEAGKTYILEAQQSEGNPLSSNPTVAVEGCPNFENGINLGIINNYPNNDSDPFVDIDCQENIGSFDPNDKRGFPEGIGPNFNIYKGTELTYHIRFQNTGTDTAFNVVVIDTLPDALDMTTLQPGLSSHDYELEIIPPNILQFNFENIMLPDSNVNELESHGFIRFDINPKEDLAFGTVIENRAAIYFDFNAPIITNTKWYTLAPRPIDSLLINTHLCEEETNETDTTYLGEMVELQTYNLIEVFNIEVHPVDSTFIDSLVTTFGDPIVYEQNVYGCDSLIFVNYILDVIDVDNSVQVHPNPFQDYLYLSGPWPQEIFYQLFDSTGKMLFEDRQVLDENGILLSMENLQGGLYFLRVETKNGRSTSQKIIKQ